MTVIRSAVKFYLLLKMVCLSLLLLSVMILLSGCLVAHTPVELQYENNVVVESLSSNVSLSYSAPGKSLSGSGFLMYHKPDQIRAVILSPFGSVLQEIYASGERMTIIDAGNGIAFYGTIMDLPTSGDFSGWRNIHWLIDIDPPDKTRGTVVIERLNRFGTQEKVAFENGLVVSKTIATGGKITYGKYTAVQKSVFPLEIIYETATNETFTMRLEEPEVNTTFADGAFTPNIDKFRLYPLSSLK